jgi:RND family efflux transporter MFP subunit
MKKVIYSAVIALTLVLAACHNSGQPKDKKAKLEELKKQQAGIQQQIADLEKELNIKDTSAATTVVGVSAAEPSTFKHYLEVQARVESDENIFVVPRVPAVITSVKVQRGDRVRKGQVLATMDPGPLAASIQQVKTQLQLASNIYERQKNLWSQKIGTEVQYIQAKSNMEALQAQVASMNEQLSMYTMTAPIDGTVDDLNLKTGEMPTPGTGGIRIVNYAKSKVLADISESYLGKIKAGDEVIVNFPDINQQITTTVKTVSSAVNTNNRTFTVEIAVDAAKYNLHPNMIAVVKINDYTNKSVITVPMNAVQHDEQGSFVYVLTQEGGNNVVHKKSIQPGQNYGNQLEVLSGLNAGDKVITTGYQNVAEGQNVSL